MLSNVRERRKAVALHQRAATALVTAGCSHRPSAEQACEVWPNTSSTMSVRALTTQSLFPSDVLLAMARVPSLSSACPRSQPVPREVPNAAPACPTPWLRWDRPGCNPALPSPGEHPASHRAPAHLPGTWQCCCHTKEQHLTYHKANKSKK